MAQHLNTSISLRVLARLLSYPDAALRSDLPDMRAALQAERALTVKRKDELYALIATLERGDALDNEAQYVNLFDRGRATSLHLFEHVHGDSRDRGPAMVDLVQTYEKAGLFLAIGELPDFLPVLLEFASSQPPSEACSLLGEMAHLFNAIFNALQQRQSAYASVLGALLELSGETAHAVNIAPDEALDAAWEEPEVFAGCSSKGQARGDQASPGQARPDQHSQPIHFVKVPSAGAKASAPTGVAP
jgi:nitrate reductase delta subunit